MHAESNGQVSAGRVDLLIDLPDGFVRAGRQFLREFEAISSEDSARHNPRAKGWFDKVKEFFEG